MLHVCCIRAGGKFSPAYTDNLFDMVRRNLEEGFEGEFVCFTDQDDPVPQGVVKRPLPHDLQGWWSKLALFKPGLFPKGDRVLFFDLDTLITGPIDALASYQGPFAMLRDFYRPEGLQSAVMAWEAGTNTEIWDGFVKAGMPTEFIPGGDQAWIEETHLEKAVRLQDVFPGMFVSYKQISAPPEKASVVVFHGNPRPHEVVAGWVPEVWKVGGLGRLELTSICNTAHEKIMGNVRSAIARDLTWFDDARPHDGHVSICGGGPSLADRLNEIRWRQEIGQTVWAVNNAAKELWFQDIRVDTQIILDARPQNAEFIRPAAEYLLSSQCAPEVFDKATGKVTLWHPHIDGIEELLKDVKDKPVHLIGGGTTVGLLAMSLAYLRGYRKIHLYGFDSCYRGSSHHAYVQTLNDGEPIIDVMFNGKSYRCAPWMAGQAQQFDDLASYLIAHGCIITAHGDGLIQDILRDIMSAPRMRPADIRAAELLKRLEGVPNPVGVEVGVYEAEMSASLLRNRPDLNLVMVDSWEGEGAAYKGDSGDWHANLSADDQQRIYEGAAQAVEFAKGRAHINRMRSQAAAEKATPSKYDFVFIDADHSYAGCKADIEAWFPRVKDGGWIGGHDYENTDFPKFGVTEAVNEFCNRYGLELELGDNFTWFVRKQPVKFKIVA
jgi:hypothetical protein